METGIESCWFEQNTSRLRRKERVVGDSEVMNFSNGFQVAGRTKEQPQILRLRCASLRMTALGGAVIEANLRSLVVCGPSGSYARSSSTCAAWLVDPANTAHRLPPLKSLTPRADNYPSLAHNGNGVHKPVRNITVCVTDEIHHTPVSAPRGAASPYLHRAQVLGVSSGMSPGQSVRYLPGPYHQVPPYPPFFRVKLSNCETVTGASEVVREGRGPRSMTYNFTSGS